MRVVNKRDVASSMVISVEGGERERETEKFMVMGTTERSKPPLHNFAMPCLKWGTQKLLRCKKVSPSSEDFDRTAEKFLIRRRDESLNKASSSAADVGRSECKSKAKSDGDDEIEAVRAKLMFDLQTAADKMKFAILGDEMKETPAVSAEAEKVRPWNLRTRRAACKAPKGTNGAIGGGDTDGGAKSITIEVRKPNFSPLRTENKKSPRFHGDSTAATDAPPGAKRERAKFSVSLSRRDIEEDFRLMGGHKPHRRPKKRPKIVQNQLDSLFPGLWLTEVTSDMYKVADAP